MGRDSSRSHIHLSNPRTVEFFEEWVSTHLPDEEIQIPPEYQPINPEDEDDVVPDQHAAFGILLSQLRRYRPAAYTAALHGGSISAASAAAAAAAVATATPGGLPMSFLNVSVWKDLDLNDMMNGGPDEAESQVPLINRAANAPFARISPVSEFFRNRHEENGIREPTALSIQDPFARDGRASRVRGHGSNHHSRRRQYDPDAIATPSGEDGRDIAIDDLRDGVTRRAHMAGRGVPVIDESAESDIETPPPTPPRQRGGADTPRRPIM
ncbi:Apc13p protein-domain-containing protein [Dipodascopsis uninucleata]